MAKVIVLGGCGAVGSVAVKTLAAQDIFDHVEISDMNIENKSISIFLNLLKSE